MPIDIRTAVAADREPCLALLEILTGAAPDARAREVYDALLDGERGEVLVAVDRAPANAGEGGADSEAGRVLGVATVSYDLAIRYRGEYCQLEELIVDPEARGQNVGGLLVEALLERARARGCAEVGLYLLERTERNRPFYAKYGFEPVGTEMRQPLRD